MCASPSRSDKFVSLVNARKSSNEQCGTGKPCPCFFAISLSNVAEFNFAFHFSSVTTTAVTEPRQCCVCRSRYNVIRGNLKGSVFCGLGSTHCYLRPRWVLSLAGSPPKLYEIEVTHSDGYPGNTQFFEFSLNLPLRSLIPKRYSTIPRVELSLSSFSVKSAGAKTPFSINGFWGTHNDSDWIGKS